jgi:hypothetical protein
MRSPGNYPPERTTLCWWYFRGGEAMAENYGKISREALPRVNAISEIAIFWGLVITVFLVVIALIKSLFG